MHIIKITPISFKIILTKEDLIGLGIENNEFTREFFTGIIEKTNALYGCPFGEGTVYADYFESKDGGGELFISRTQSEDRGGTYLFRDESSEKLHSLCKRLDGAKEIVGSSLYFCNGKYNLVLYLCKKNNLFLSILREYGQAEEVSSVSVWLLEEHADAVIRKTAVTKLAQLFSG